MKRVFIYLAAAAVITGCGGAPATQVTPPDQAAYKAVEVTAKSNADRLLKLESDLDSAKKEVQSLLVQNRQLADSYDGLVEIVKDQRDIMMVLINKVNALTAPAESKQPENKQPEKK